MQDTDYDSNFLRDKSKPISKNQLVSVLIGKEKANKVEYDILPELERLKTKLRNSNATYGLKPIDAKTRKSFFKGLNDLIVDLLYHDDFADDETADTDNDESEQNAPPADSNEHKEHTKT